MKTSIEFRDGATTDLELPEDARHLGEFVTGHPEKMENVTVKFSHWDTRGAVYREVPPALELVQ